MHAADQFKAFDGVEVHYVVVNTLFLQPDVAARYGVVRANDRAIVNLSVINDDGAAVLGEVTGSTINLLSQTAPLQFCRRSRKATRSITSRRCGIRIGTCCASD